MLRGQTKQRLRGKKVCGKHGNNKHPSLESERLTGWGAGKGQIKVGFKCRENR